MEQINCKELEILGSKKNVSNFGDVYYCKLLKRWIAPYLCQNCKYNKKEDLEFIAPEKNDDDMDGIKNMNNKISKVMGIEVKE